MLKFHEGLLTGSIPAEEARTIGRFFEALGAEEPTALNKLLGLSAADGQAVHDLLRSLLPVRPVRNVKKTRRGEHTRQIVTVLGQEIAQIEVDSVASNDSAASNASPSLSWR